MSFSSFYSDFTFYFNFFTNDLYFNLISWVFTISSVFYIFFYYSSIVAYSYFCCEWRISYLLIIDARSMAFLMFLSKCTSLAETWIRSSYFIFYWSLRFYYF